MTGLWVNWLTSKKLADCKYNDYYWEKQEKTQFFFVCTASGATDSALWTYCPDMLLRRP